jgi:hypothetical protein
LDILAERAPYFFFFHNGITALCNNFNLSDDKKRLRVRGLSVVNGCQSLSTIYATSGKVAQNGQAQGSVLFRFYEISQYDLGEAISINTNSQTAAAHRAGAVGSSKAECAVKRAVPSSAES